MNDVIPHEDAPPPAMVPANSMPRPMQRMAAGTAVATVTIEAERAIAEVKGKLFVAKQFPRDEQRAHGELMRACQIFAFAEKAFYSYSRGGETISGPSIRLAEEIARCWGNIDYGIRELAHHDDRSEVEAYAWDMETNTVSPQRFTVKHVRDTKKGAKPLTEQRDIYENNANMAGRRLRARILAVVPKWLVQAAVEECRNTLSKGVSTNLDESRRRLAAAFLRHGVTAKMIEAKMGRAVAALTAEDILELRGVFQAIADGEVGVADHFDPDAEKSEKAKEIADLAAKTVDTTKPPISTQAPTTEAPTTEAPTTEPPTTEPPTTEKPTTEAPTTEKPTTAAPTTAKPKAAAKPAAAPPQQEDAPPPAAGASKPDLF